MNRTKSLAGLLTLLCTILFVSSFVLFAGCGNKVKIKFNLNYENPTTSIKAIKIEKETCVDDDEDATWPAVPTRDGYTFVGWYDNADGTGTAYLSSTEIDEDVTLYAKWQLNGSGGPITPNSGSGQTTPQSTVYTVTFDTQCDWSVPSQTVTSGGKAKKPSSDPMRIGYDFVKWVTTANGSTEFNFDTPIYAPTVIYAQWKEITAGGGGQTTTEPTGYTIKFVDADMGDVSPYYESVISMAYPIKEGYTFIGWTATGLGADAEVASYETGGYVHWNGSLMKTTVFKHLTSVGNTVTLTANWTKDS